MNNKIIDVSKWNAIINYQSVAENVDGVIIRAGWRGYTEGVLAMDPRFLPYIKGLQEKEVPVGVYFHSCAITENEAIDEANFVCDIVLSSMCQLSFPIFINSDWSNSAHNGRSDKLSIDERTSIINAFINRCNERGYLAGVCAKEQWFIEKLNLKKIHGVIWVESTNNVAIKANVVAVKYNKKAEIPGIAGVVDLSEWYGSIGVENSIFIEEAKVVDEDKHEEPIKKKYLKGDSITVSNSPVYKSNNASTIIDTVSGKFTVISARVLNSRVKISDENENAIGWVEI